MVDSGIPTIGDEMIPFPVDTLENRFTRLGDLIIEIMNRNEKCDVSITNLAFSLLVNDSKIYDELFHDPMKTLEIHQIGNDSIVYDIMNLVCRYSFRLWKLKHAICTSMETYDDELMLLSTRSYVEAIQKLLFVFWNVNKMYELKDDAGRRKLYQDIMKASVPNRKERSKNKRTISTDKQTDGVVEQVKFHESFIAGIITNHFDKKGIRIEWDQILSKKYYDKLSLLIHTEEKESVWLFSDTIEKHNWYQVTDKGINNRMDFSFGAVLHHATISINTFTMIETGLMEMYPNMYRRSCSDMLQ